MTTIIIDEKTKKGKIILELVREMDAGQIVVNKPAFNRVTLDAIKEAAEGQTTHCKSFDDYLEKVR